MSGKNEQGSMDVKQNNVYQKPLHQHSSPSPQTSKSPTLKSGFCSARAPIAVTLTNSFLDFSAARGFDLRKQGVGPGQRWCIEASRWNEALQSRDGDQDPDDRVPKVKLECTHAAALENVSLANLRRFSAEQDVGSVVWPKDRPSDGVRQSGSIGAKGDPKA
ncbi:hypothetical protein BCR34DRAFT_621534 [Clohesyomyces aquaticus]|uniref:Uncharacterized protein n=1 Tax=Clohesyomyces aquaticus TaxID=1231657 RepID=A0A1Y2A7Y8_9PLEO|nr:hypothetical protein BCR34DRAFT_621534 [Clohesyomyces aquaticus]